MDETDASHHQQVRRADHGFTISATHLDRQGILSIHRIPQGGAQHELQSEEYRKDDRLEDTTDHLRGTPHMGKRSLAHEHSDSHHQ